MKKFIFALAVALVAAVLLQSNTHAEEASLWTVPPAPPETTIPMPPTTAPTDTCPPGKGPEPCTTVPMPQIPHPETGYTPGDNVCVPFSAQEYPEQVPPVTPWCVPSFSAVELPTKPWNYWGFDEGNMVSNIDAILVGATYCVVNAQFGPLGSYMVTGRPVLNGEISGDPNVINADEVMLPVQTDGRALDPNHDGYSFASSDGLVPNARGYWSVVNRTFGGSCPEVGI